MSKGTVIYAGGFRLPDKNAAANRVVSNGKLFGLCGYRTVFLGAADYSERFDGIKRLNGHEEMFEQAHPATSAEWIRHMFSVENIESLVNRYGDVKKIVLYNVPLFTLLKAKHTFKKKNIKVCYDCTEWTSDTDGTFLKRAFKAVDEFLIRNFAHTAADGMIVISDVMKNKYRKNKNLMLLPPLVDVNDGMWHQKPEKHPETFEFCFAGVPDGNKDSLDKVIEAFGCLNNEQARLRIIGVSHEEFRAIYPDCSVSDSTFKRIYFMGRLPHYETVKFILGCDCYIFIRESDRRNNAGFPTKFAEAFTCAVPIITTDVSDIKQYLLQSSGCLLNEISSQKVAEAMSRVIKEKHCGCCKKLNRNFHYESFYQNCKEWLEK